MKKGLIFLIPSFVLILSEDSTNKALNAPLRGSNPINCEQKFSNGCQSEINRPDENSKRKKIPLRYCNACSRYISQQESDRKQEGGSLVYGAVEDRSDICCKKLHPASSSVFRIVAHQSRDPSFSTEKLIYTLLIIRSIMNKLAINRDLFIYLFIYREKKKDFERIVNICEEKYL